MSRQMRRERVLELLDRHNLEAALFTRPENFAWYTNGADNRVDHSGTSVAALLVSAQGEWVVTDNIEAPRMRQEQTTAIEVAEYPWYEDFEEVVLEIAGNAPIGSDSSLDNMDSISDRIAELRYVLDPDAAARYRSVGSDTVDALVETEDALSPEMTEIEAAALFSASLQRRELNSPVKICSSMDRASRYRHPVSIAPHQTRLGRGVMLVTCAERGGLYANATRLVDFEEPSAETRQLRDACSRILTGARQATQQNRTLAEVFDDIRFLYDEEGLSEGWRHHHQGGITGYSSREIVATPYTDQKIQEGMAFAWNPSFMSLEHGTFGKAEETFLLTQNGSELLT